MSKPLNEKYRKVLTKSCNYFAWYRFLYAFFYVPMKILFPGRALGMENLPQESGYILAFNHRNGIEVPVSYYAIPGYRHFVCKEEMYNHAFMRWLCPRVGAIPIDRENPDLSSMRRIVNTLKKNEVVSIFPEGTRNYDEDSEMRDFKSGTALFALQSKTPVIPVYIYRNVKPFKRNLFYIGKPIYPPSGVVNATAVDNFMQTLQNAFGDVKTYLTEIVENGRYKAELKAEKARLKVLKKEKKSNIAKKPENI